MAIAPTTPPDPDAVTAAVARNARALRQARGWTLAALAARSGLSKGMVVELEQGRTNPSIGTLCRLARALGVGLAELLDVGNGPELRVVTSDDAVRLWNGAFGGWGDFLVGARAPVQVELWGWTLQPRDVYDGSIDPEGSRELLYVLQGEITLVLDHRHRATLPERTAALYSSDRPHRIENDGTVSARMIMVSVEGKSS